MMSEWQILNAKLKYKSFQESSGHYSLFDTSWDQITGIILRNINEINMECHLTCFVNKRLKKTKYQIIEFISHMSHANLNFNDQLENFAREIIISSFMIVIFTWQKYKMANETCNSISNKTIEFIDVENIFWIKLATSIFRILIDL